MSNDLITYFNTSFSTNCEQVKIFTVTIFIVTLVYSIAEYDMRPIEHILCTIMFNVICVTLLSAICNSMPDVTYTIIIIMMLLLAIVLYKKIPCIENDIAVNRYEKERTKYYSDIKTLYKK